MSGSDTIEIKRAGPPPAELAEALAERPPGPTPTASAPEAEREAWAMLFLPWFFSLTGGEWPVPPEALGAEGGAYVGRRWRTEFFDCVSDPQGFEAYAEEEIETYKSNGAV